MGERKFIRQWSIDYFRLLQRHNCGKPIRTEFILLLCPDERLNEQIRAFSNETFRQLTKEIPHKDRQYLRAFKLSNFFHVTILLFHINAFNFCVFLRFLIDMFTSYIKSSILLPINIIEHWNKYSKLSYISTVIIWCFCPIHRRKNSWKRFLD